MEGKGDLRLRPQQAKTPAFGFSARLRGLAAHISRHARRRPRRRRRCHEGQARRRQRQQRQRQAAAPARHGGDGDEKRNAVWQERKKGKSWEVGKWNKGLPRK